MDAGASGAVISASTGAAINETVSVSVHSCKSPSRAIGRWLG